MKSPFSRLDESKPFFHVFQQTPPPDPSPVSNDLWIVGIKTWAQFSSLTSLNDTLLTPFPASQGMQKQSLTHLARLSLHSTGCLVRSWITAKYQPRRRNKHQGEMVIHALPINPRGDSHRALEEQKPSVKSTYRNKSVLLQAKDIPNFDIFPFCALESNSKRV